MCWRPPGAAPGWQLTATRRGRSGNGRWTTGRRRRRRWPTPAARPRRRRRRRPSGSGGSGPARRRRWPTSSWRASRARSAAGATTRCRPPPRARPSTALPWPRRGRPSRPPRRRASGLAWRWSGGPKGGGGLRGLDERLGAACGEIWATRPRPPPKPCRGRSSRRRKRRRRGETNAADRLEAA